MTVRTRFLSSGFATAWWILLAVEASHAGPPLITDDPDTPGRNRWEVNISYTLQVMPEPLRTEPSRLSQLATGITSRFIESLGLGLALEPKPRTIHRRTLEHEIPLIDINYGVTDRDQLKVEVPVLSLDPVQGSTQGGVGNILVGYKYRILDENDFPFSLSLYPQVELPPGARKLGLSRKPAYILPIEVGRHFLDDRLFLYGEVGFVATPEAGFDDEWFYGIAVEWQADDRIKLLGEVHENVPMSGPAESDVVFNLGFKWEISEQVALLTAMGRSLHSADADRPEFLGFWGFQFNF